MTRRDSPTESRLPIEFHHNERDGTHGARYAVVVRLAHARIPACAALGAIFAIVGVGERTARAAPPSAAECVAATERGQSKRDDGQLVASRAEFAACGADECPAVVRRECVRWLADVDARIPSLVVSIADSNGKDVTHAELTLDGARIPVGAAGHAFPLDPGPHVLRASGDRVRPSEEHIVVRERERERVVRLVLSSTDPVVPAATTKTPNVVQRERTVPVASWVLGAVAVAGGAGFAILWTKGLGDVSDLRRSCSPYCSSAQIDDARTPLTLARISAGIGIAAAIAAVATYWLQPTTSATF